ncbi:MAG: type II secretion system protein GspL [Thermodesulfobacteriota bacterium]
MSRSILSIDIRDEAISALRISSTLKGNRIESQFHIPLNQAPPDTENRLLWAFSQMADAMDTSGCACILSVPPSAVIYRNVTVPFKERRKIGQLLPFELESSLPRAVEGHLHQ